MNPFAENVLGDWGGEIKMSSVKGQPDMRRLLEPLPCGDTYIPAGFIWDGSSVPRLLRGFFPKHRHPIASCRHDYRCNLAKNKHARKFADKEFRKDVGKTSWKVTAVSGYIGVRIGAFFGIGSNF